MTIERVNPNGLFKLEAFTQVVSADAVGSVAYIAGQGAFDADFKLVGAGDLHAQTVQAFKNLRTAVEAVGGTVGDIVSTNMYIVDINPEKVDTFGRAMAEALDDGELRREDNSIRSPDGVVITLTGFVISCEEDTSSTGDVVPTPATSVAPRWMTSATAP